MEEVAPHELLLQKATYYRKLTGSRVFASPVGAHSAIMRAVMTALGALEGLQRKDGCHGRNTRGSRKGTTKNRGERLHSIDPVLPGRERHAARPNSDTWNCTGPNDRSDSQKRVPPCCDVAQHPNVCSPMSAATRT